MKTLKLTLALAGMLVVAAPLAYSADPAGSSTEAKAPASKAHVLSRTYEQQGGTLAKVARPATTTAAAGTAPH